MSKPLPRNTTSAGDAAKSHSKHTGLPPLYRIIGPATGHLFNGQKEPMETHTHGSLLLTYTRRARNDLRATTPKCCFRTRATPWPSGTETYKHNVSQIDVPCDVETMNYNVQWRINNIYLSMLTQANTKTQL